MLKGRKISAAPLPLEEQVHDDLGDLLDHLAAVHSTVEEPESIEMAELAQIQPLEAS